MNRSRLYDFSPAAMRDVRSHIKYHTCGSSKAALSVLSGDVEYRVPHVQQVKHVYVYCMCTRACFVVWNLLVRSGSYHLVCIMSFRCRGGKCVCMHVYASRVCACARVHVRCVELDVRAWITSECLVLNVLIVF